MAKDYEIIEHTADVGIRVRAADLESLFKNAALAMFDIIAEKNELCGVSKKLKLKLSADDLDELFVTWLNELLSLSATKELIFSDFMISKLEKTSLEAVIEGPDIKNYKVNIEIKAATYHNLKLQQEDNGWVAEVIFDV